MKKLIILTILLLSIQSNADSTHEVQSKVSIRYLKFLKSRSGFTTHEIIEHNIDVTDIINQEILGLSKSDLIQYKKKELENEKR